MIIKHTTNNGGTEIEQMLLSKKTQFMPLTPFVSCVHKSILYVFASIPALKIEQE